ncbi:hypothetical protein [Clostridium sp. ZBS4]|nr:hypothetical protein [Clostridium sp. ZBS4]
MKYNDIKNLYSGNVDDLPTTSRIYFNVCTINGKNMWVNQKI